MRSCPQRHPQPRVATPGLVVPTRAPHTLSSVNLFSALWAHPLAQLGLHAPSTRRRDHAGRRQDVSHHATGVANAIEVAVRGARRSAHRLMLACTPSPPRITSIGHYRHDLQIPPRPTTPWTSFCAKALDSVWLALQGICSYCINVIQCRVDPGSGSILAKHSFHYGSGVDRCLRHFLGCFFFFFFSRTPYITPVRGSSSPRLRSFGGFFFGGYCL